MVRRVVLTGDDPSTHTPCEGKIRVGGTVPEQVPQQLDKLDDVLEVSISVPPDHSKSQSIRQQAEQKMITGDDASGPVEVEASGSKFEIFGHDAEYIFSSIIKSGLFYERDLLDTLSAIPWPAEAWALDVGANIGNHSLHFAGVLGLKVHAFEPEEGNFALLQQNVKHNSLENRVTCHNLALGSTSDSLHLQQRIPGNSGTYEVVNQPGNTTVVPFDDLDIQEDVALVKIDVEGFEDHVIRGMMRMIESSRPIVVVECHRPTDVRNLFSRLAEYGYSVGGIHGLSDNYILFPGMDATPIDRSILERLLDVRTHRLRHRENSGVLRSIESKIDDLREGRSGPIGSSEALASTLSEVIDLRVLLTREYERISTAYQEAREAEVAARYWESQYNRLLKSRALSIVRGARKLLNRELDGHAPSSSRRHRDRIKLQMESARRAAVPPKVSGLLAGHSHPKQSQTPGNDRVRVALATVPERVDGLRRVVDSLYDQTDELCVWLNGFDEIPEFLLRPKVMTRMNADLGDRGKFAFLSGFDGYYLTVDDDIEYPSYYVRHMVDGIERYGRRVAVGWHGSVLNDGFSQYYDDPDSRRVLSFRTARGVDTEVDILGTGCTGFHSETLKLKFSDLKMPNMADLYFARTCRRQGVGRVVLAHNRNEAVPIEFDDSIYQSSSRGSGTQMDVGEASTKFVREFLLPRQPIKPSPLFVRESLNVAVIGRVSRDRWKKGGIVKSTHLLREMLMGLGASVSMHELQETEADDVSASGPDIAIVYPGDPERPDFAHTVELVRGVAERGYAVLVNLSYNLAPERCETIIGFVRELHAEGLTKVRALLFSDTALDTIGVDERQYCFEIPKSIELPSRHRVRFEETSGVFLGDFGKLCREDLLDYPVEEWVVQTQEALPEARLYAVQQYRPKFPKDLGVEVVPYSDDLFLRLGSIRLMVSPFRYCTFEMVPVELAAAGVPIVYRSMPQSLSKYLGAGGMAVQSPEELGGLLPHIYRDPTVWASASSAGVFGASSGSHHLQSGLLYARLKQYLSMVSKDG